MKRTRLFCVLLAAAMLLSLAACGKDDPKESNSLQIGDYALLYKGASIMEDSDGNDALVLTLDFTNNGKEATSYLWAVSEKVFLDGIGLNTATVLQGAESGETVTEAQLTEIMPGKTIQVQSAYHLPDGDKKTLEAEFSQLLGKKKGILTIDLEAALP